MITNFLVSWVRARGMSIYQMAIMGASALGAALWGQVAAMTSVQTSLLIVAASGVITMLGAHLLVVDLKIEEDLTPSTEFKAPVAEDPPSSGHVLVTIEYLIPPQRAAEIRTLMQESRRSRLRQGALSWDLLRDIATQGDIASKSSMSPGPSTCAVLIVLPQRTWPSESANWPCIAAKRRRW